MDENSTTATDNSEQIDATASGATDTESQATETTRRPLITATTSIHQSQPNHRLMAISQQKVRKVLMTIAILPQINNLTVIWTNGLKKLVARNPRLTVSANFIRRFAMANESSLVKKLRKPLPRT